MPQKYVDDIVRPALVDTVILSKVMEGDVTQSDLDREVREAGIDLGNLDVEERVRTLEQSGHLRTEGHRLRITDDGREDVQKVLPWLQRVAETAETAGTVRTGRTR